MPVVSIGPADALPRSHCFLSYAHGRTIRTVRVRTGGLRLALLAIATLTVWLIGSSLYLVFHDDLVAALMAREATAQYAYEDRISALRSQVDHEASLKLVGQTSLDARLKDLAQRAAALEQRENLLDEIAARTGGTPGRTGGERLPVAHAAPAAGPEVDNPVDPAPTGSTGAVTKPHPEVDGALDESARPDRDQRSINLRLASLEARLERVDAGQIHTLGSVQAVAHQHVEALRAAIITAGVSPERVVSHQQSGSTGGPYVPLDPAIMASPFGHALDAMQADIGAATALSQALPRLPFGRPLEGALEVTSPFGARLDPFMGRPAMHTGVDLRDEYGTAVRATAAGRVVSAGPAGGYGTMIEIDHGNGLATRYAHLSAVGVAVGQTVEKGAVIGDVGASGRATGPHLHYETRIDGAPVDPERFLLAGARVAALDRSL